MNISQIPHAYLSLGRRLLAAAPLAALAALVLSSTSVYAAEGSQYGSIGQYGEMTRFGGFDTTWFDEGKYDGKGTPGPNESGPKSGLFLNPVGFAVDSDDEGKGTTAIYVLDRVSGYPTAGSLTTEWRLQKLSDTDTVLGTTEFYLPETLVTGVHVPTGVVGLAIDDATGRIYTIVYETTGSGSSATSYAKEIVGWSTTPDSEDKLVAPEASGSYPALPEETSGPITPVSGYKTPGLLTAALASPSPALYGPLSLALDVTGGQDYLAIEADSKVKTGSTNVGPAVVEQVSTVSGAETASWSASSLTTTAFPNASSTDHTAPAEGIATDPGPTQNGSLDVLLYSNGVNPVRLQANLTAPTILDSSKIENSDEWAKSISILGSEPGPAGAAVAELSNGLYASDFWENGAGAGYWNEGANEGIRLLEPEANGLLSNPLLPATSIFDTLGNATPSGACNISAAGAGHSNQMAFAAGANGTVWVLTAGQDSSGYSGSGSDAAYIAGREVIEFSPGASNRCVSPTGTFLWTKAGGSQQSASEPLTVPVGSTVDFDASSIDYPTSVANTQAAIYAYEWDPTGASTGGTNNNGYTTISTTEEELQPTPTTSYQYTTPGVYTAKLKLLGTFGEYDETGTIVVQTTEPPTAAFTAPSEVQVNQPVSFNASASQPASGASIADYHWGFGDGTPSDETQEPADTHAYSSPGTYTVTLTVRDNDNQQSTQFSRQITVTSPLTGSLGGGENGGSNNGGGGSTGSSPTSPTQGGDQPKSSATTSSKPKTLTRAQQLANALKACKKDKPKKKRESCEKQAKKKYAPKPKSKPKKKLKSKKK